MTPLSATRIILTAGAIATLLPSCRIVNGRMDFFWIQEQFAPPINDTVVVTSVVGGTRTSYVTPENVTILTMQPAVVPAATPAPAAASSPVAQNQPAPTPAPAPAPAPEAAKQNTGWFGQQQAPVAAAPAAPRTYVVAKGDTLSGIARKHRVTLRALLQANGIAPDKADTLRDGQILNIPEPGVQRKAQPARKAAETPTPQPAETASQPAPAPQPAASTPQPAPAPQSAENKVQPTIAPQPEVGASQPATAPGLAPRVYTVLKGDTMTGIARKHGITISALLQANGIAPENADTLRDGQTLNIPAPTR